MNNFSKKGNSLQDLSYKDKHWHEACFLCSKCRVSLVDKQFGAKAEKIYCGNCYDTQFASRCDGCGEIFRAGKLSNIIFLFSSFIRTNHLSVPVSLSPPTLGGVTLRYSDETKFLVVVHRSVSRRYPVKVPTP